MIGKKSVRASAVFDSVFKISPFLLLLIVSLMYDLYESDCFIILENVLLSVFVRAVIYNPWFEYNLKLFFMTATVIKWKYDGPVSIA